MYVRLDNGFSNSKCGSGSLSEPQVQSHWAQLASGYVSTHLLDHHLLISLLRLYPVLPPLSGKAMLHVCFITALLGI